MSRIFNISALLCLFISSTTYAEEYFSFYGGVQSSPHSRVSGVDGQGNEFNFLAGWEGKPFILPPYYGLRYTNWSENNTGVSLDFSHSKVYADAKTLDKSGFKVLEFTDGINVLTLNYLKKYPNRYNLYWGAGAGITLPHVEVQTSSNASKTFEYQFGGYALQTQIGMEKKISKDWKMFLEYKFNYTINNVNLNGGGNLKTNIITNALNFGINYKF